MANPYAGEVAIKIDGQERICKLTLGSLAELETKLEAGTLTELIGRFEAGACSSRDILMLIVAGLRGGGWFVTEAELLAADIEGGPIAAAKAAAEMLARAFSVG